MLSLARQPQRSKHILNKKLLPLPYRGQQQLKSRHPFMRAALKLLKDFFKSDTSLACSAETK